MPCPSRRGYSWWNLGMHEGRDNWTWVGLHVDDGISPILCASSFLSSSWEPDVGFDLGESA